VLLRILENTASLLNTQNEGKVYVRDFRIVNFNATSRSIAVLWKGWRRQLPWSDDHGYFVKERRPGHRRLALSIHGGGQPISTKRIRVSCLRRDL